MQLQGCAGEGRLRANVLKDGKVLDSLLFARIQDNSASAR